MTRALILCALVALSCTEPTTLETGDAMAPTNDANDDASSSTDASSDGPILPEPGTWAWAKYELASGKLARRASWPGGYLIRQNGMGYQMSSTGGSSWFSAAWLPASDDTTATNWTSLFSQ